MHEIDRYHQWIYRAERAFCGASLSCMWYNILFAYVLFFLLPFPLACFLSLCRCIVFLSPSEHLQADWAINYLYWASVPVSVVLVNRPYHCQSISNVASVRLRQTFRRNQPIYRGTMDQHDSIVSCRLRINRSLPLFLRSDRYLYPILRTATLFLYRLFNYNNERDLDQTFLAAYSSAKRWLSSWDNKKTW